MIIRSTIRGTRLPAPCLFISHLRYKSTNSSTTTPASRSTSTSTSTATPTSAPTPTSTATPLSNTLTKPITPESIKKAYARISSVVKRSPLDFSQRLSDQIGSQIYLKKEHISLTGSYKERGALNKILQLTDEEKARGVICSSAGNHAQAVSHHSTRLGINGVIVMPNNAPFIKMKTTKEFGAKVVLAGESFSEAYEHAVKIAKEEGRTFIHAFNDPHVIAGQGTVAMELLEQNPYLDAVIVPIGGGGLIAGMALFLKSINPRIKVYGVESAAMPGMYQSFKAGHLVSVPKRASMADGIAIENVGPLAFDLIKKHVDDIVLVEEDEIAAACLSLLEIEKTVVEGSGAVGLAALQCKRIPDIEDKQVAVICTGGNIDMTLLGRIIEKGLVKAGRMARIHVTVLDIPGQLAKVLNILFEMRANVINIEHERAFLVANVGMTQPILTLETRGFEHVQEIVERLKSSGFERVYLETPIQ